MSAYDHKKIEKKWQEYWAKNKIYSTPDEVPGKDNFYLLVEFPYPSGNLHVGHWYAFAIPDILARYQRMQGKNVMYPIGFDAFGLPAENAAIKNKLNPRDWTEKNIAYMTKQIETMGTSFDWSRKVSTIDPAYYKWTQWLFLQLYKKGLVYQKETAVNWCPKDKTVLANEQVVDGKCERCDSEVEQKQMLQWNIKITDYADRLIDDLAQLDWPEQIKESQRNWIGRSEGAEIDFPLQLADTVKRVVILHAKGATPETDFYRWLEKKLTERGYEVELPVLPNTNEPDDVEQTQHVLDTCHIDESTVLVGHSFGCIVALRLLEHGKRAAKVTLVSPGYFGEFLDGKSRPTVTNALKKGFDFDTIRKNCASFTVLHDVNDPIIPEKDADTISEKLGARLMKVRANGSHFNSAIEEDVLMVTAPTIRVFTTRPDTLFGATYLVLAPEHPWVRDALAHESVLKNSGDVQKYVDAAAKKSDLERQADQKEKSGVRLEGVSAVNPATGEKIPLYVADYVLGHYGTGAIMAVPAHDERDHAFAKKFDLPVKQVIAPVVTQTSGGDAVRANEPFRTRDAVMCIVKHWNKDEYLCQQWIDHPEVKTFISGGIEDGEDIVDAGKREIAEESGYTDVKYVRQVKGFSFVEFYHQVKKTNIRARFRYLYFELRSDAQQEIPDEEKKKHTLIWKKRDEVHDFLHLLERDAVWKAFEDGAEAAYTGDGVLVQSGEYDGKSVSEAKSALTEKYGRSKKTYKLRDWIVSRQRYWGVPIPIVHCEKCGASPVPDEQLPVELPAVEDYLPDGKGKSPLAKVREFVDTTCPTCGNEAKRETDTLDTFVDSSWYFLRYTDPHDPDEFAALAKQEHWMPVDLYSGGAEHTTMHLLYSRFWHKALFDCGLVKDPEPYKRRMNRSLIMGPDGQKMSKSRGNVIDPDEVVENLGADTVRMYLAFIGPYNEVASYPWNPDGVVGVRRFIERVWKLSENLSDGEGSEAALHRAIKKVSDDVPRQKFNTAISALMIYVNDTEKGGATKEQFGTFLRLLAPFAPHMTEELWHTLGNDSSIHAQQWPTYDERHLEDENVTYAIQVDGKTRGEVRVPAGADNKSIELAAAQEVADRLSGADVARVIVVPKRLINFVLKK